MPKPPGRHAWIRARMLEGFVSKTDSSPYAYIYQSTSHRFERETLRGNVHRGGFCPKGDFFKRFHPSEVASSIVNTTRFLLCTFSLFRRLMPRCSSRLGSVREKMQWGIVWFGIVRMGCAAGQMRKAIILSEQCLTVITVELIEYHFANL